MQFIESQHYLQDYSKKEQACESLSVRRGVGCRAAPMVVGMT